MSNKQRILTQLSLMIQNGINLTTRNIEVYGSRYGITKPQIIKEFTSFNNAKLELGLSIHSNKYTKEEVISKLQAIYAKYGTLSKDILEVEKEIYVNSKTVFRLWPTFQDMYDEVLPNIVTTRLSKGASAVINLFSGGLDEQPILEKKFDWLKNPLTRI